MSQTKKSAKSHKGHFIDRFFDESSPQLDSFGTVLVLTLISIGVLLFANIDLKNSAHVNFAALLVNFTVGLTLIYSLRASGLAKRHLIPITILIIISLVATAFILLVNQLTDVAVDTAGYHGISPLWVIIAIITPFASTWRLLHHKKVTINTLYAAIASYLQIALAYTFLYMYIASVSVEPFFGQIQRTTSFMYYSLTTISTVGFGDLFTTSELGRALTASEAIVGQIYLVVLVAMLVGIFVNAKNR